MIRSILTVARREVRGLVDQPTAYLLAVAFLGLALYLAFRNMYALGVATLRPLFDLLPTLFAVLVPALTMRSLAEEKRSRTLDWLLAQPLDEWAVVLGKFLGSWVFILIVLAGTLPSGLGLLAVSDADPGIMVAQYLGGALLAAQLTAIGIWASATTRNQVTAFILAAGLSFTLFLIGLPGILQGAPPIVSGILSQLSVLGHFEGVARGVVDLRDVVYFVSVTALFLVLAVEAVSEARLAPGGKDAKRLQLGTLVVAVIALAVNLLGGQIHGRLDLTRDDLFTLSDGSRQVLGELDDLVQITLFASDELPPEVALELRDVRDLLGDMARAGGSLRVRDLDPDDDPAAAEQAANLGIQPIEFNVLRDDEFQIRRGYYGLAVTYADEREVIPAIQRTDDLEYRLISAIARMTADERRAILFATDGGARPPGAMPGIQETVGSRYDLSARTIGDDSFAPPTPDSVDVLVVAGPTETLDSLTVDRIDQFVHAGGSALLLVDPIVIDPQLQAPLPISTGLEPILEARGVSLAEGLVGDLASAERVSLGQQGGFSVIVSYPLWPITFRASDHVTTRGLGSLNLGWPGAFELAGAEGATALWQTSERGFLRDPTSPIDPQAEWTVPEAELAVRTVAVAIDPAIEGSVAGAPGRMIAVADVTFSEIEFLQAAPQNLTFLANAFDWLAQDEALIAIRSKDRTPPGLAFTSDVTRGMLRWGNLAGVPLLFVLVGVIRVTGRRRRAEKRWHEVVSP